MITIFLFVTSIAAILLAVPMYILHKSLLSGLPDFEYATGGRRTIDGSGHGLRQRGVITAGPIVRDQPGAAGQQGAGCSCPKMGTS